MVFYYDELSRAMLGCGYGVGENQILMTLHCSTTVTLQVTLWRMIKTFADKRTQQLYATGRAKRVPPDLAKRAARKLEYIDLAQRLDDLKVPPGNRLHTLEGDRKGQHSIAVNDQWRISFRFVDGDAFDVEFCDYH